MPDIQKSMKLSLAFGLSGAVILPVLYEVYANISAAAGLVLIAVWAVCAGAKFSALKFKEAFMGMVCTLAYAGILGVICYIVIHPKVSDMLQAVGVFSAQFETAGLFRALCGAYKPLYVPCVGRYIWCEKGDREISAQP